MISRRGRQIKRQNYLSEYETYTAYCLLMSENDPQSYEEEVRSEEWRKAIKAHEKSKT